MEKILEEVRAEMKRSTDKFGVQDHHPIEWLAILMEEVGEASKEIVDFHFRYPYKDGRGDIQEVEEDDVVQSIRLSNYRKELIQVANVALKMVASFDRNYGTCKVCGCTDQDCTKCIERTGSPCHWVDGEHNLCSACIDIE